MNQKPSEHIYIAPTTAIDYLYVNESLLVVDKPAGLLSVPGRGANKQDCLIQRVQQDFTDALIVHRLDMDTSGLMVLARSTEAHRFLSEEFAQRRVKKIYVALLDGVLEQDEGQVELPLMTDWPNRPLQKVDPLQGKVALTHYRVLERDYNNKTTRVELEPYTGRTHQLRVHMASLGHSIIGDRLYGNISAKRLMLHAQRLEFAHPLTGEVMALSALTPF